MEQNVAVECFKNVINSDLDPNPIASDGDDSASINKCHKEARGFLEKLCNYGHLKNNVFFKIGSKHKRHRKSWSILSIVSPTLWLKIKVT